MTLKQVIWMHCLRMTQRIMPTKVDTSSSASFFVNFMQLLVHKSLHKCQIITFQRMSSTQSANTWYQRHSCSAALWVCMLFQITLFKLICNRTFHVLLNYFWFINRVVFGSFHFSMCKHAFHSSYFCISSTDHCSARSFWATRCASITNFTHEMHSILIFVLFLRPPHEPSFSRRSFGKSANTW